MFDLSVNLFILLLCYPKAIQKTLGHLKQILKSHCNENNLCKDQIATFFVFIESSFGKVILLQLNEALSDNHSDLFSFLLQNLSPPNPKRVCKRKLGTEGGKRRGNELCDSPVFFQIGIDKKEDDFFKYMKQHLSFQQKITGIQYSPCVGNNQAEPREKNIIC